MSVGAPKDLVVLVADVDMEATIEGILGRHESLGVRPIQAALYRHPNRDCGCRAECQDFLRPFSSSFTHALVLFDREGQGELSHCAARGSQASIARPLRRAGADDRARALH